MVCSFGNGINGFTGNEVCCKRKRQLPAYGSIYNEGSKNFTVELPGEFVPITFSSNALLSKGLVHIPGNAEVFVCSPGDYEIDFTLYFTSSTAAFAAFCIRRNDTALPGGVYSKMLSTDYQIYSGSTMLELSSGDIIRLCLTAPQAIDITLAGNDVTAFLNIKKLN